MDLITSELTIIIGGVMLLIGIGIGMMVDNSEEAEVDVLQQAITVEIIFGIITILILIIGLLFKFYKYRKSRGDKSGKQN